MSRATTVGRARLDPIADAADGVTVVDRHATVPSRVDADTCPETDRSRRRSAGAAATRSTARRASPRG